MNYFLTRNSELVETEDTLDNSLQLSESEFSFLQNEIAKNKIVKLENNKVVIINTSWLHNGAIYRSDINGSDIPRDAVLLTKEQDEEIRSNPTKKFYFENDVLNSESIVTPVSDKERRDRLIKSVVYDFEDNRIIQLDMETINYLDFQIKKLNALGLDGRFWKMRDNKKYWITVNEMEIARDYGLTTYEDIWNEHLNTLEEGTIS